MLTDYHLHLRPDDLDATRRRVLHRGERRPLPRGGGRGRGSPSSASPSTSTGSPTALEIWDHPFWRAVRASTTSPPTASSCARRRCGSGSRWTSSPAARTGSPTCSTRTSSTTSSARSTSSATGAVDDDDFDVWDVGADPDRLWRRYFETLAEAARSGLYDILAHPDLVKFWGDRAARSPSATRASTTSPRSRRSPRPGSRSRSRPPGWRKPVDELYPSDAFAEMCVDAGRRRSRSPPTPTCPRTSGRDYDRAVETMRGWGVEEICVFERRERRLEPLG